MKRKYHQLKLDAIGTPKIFTLIGAISSQGIEGIMAVELAEASDGLNVLVASARLHGF